MLRPMPARTTHRRGAGLSPQRDRPGIGKWAAPRSPEEDSNVRAMTKKGAKGQPQLRLNSMQQGLPTNSHRSKGGFNTEGDGGRIKAHSDTEQSEDYGPLARPRGGSREVQGQSRKDGREIARREEPKSAGIGRLEEEEVSLAGRDAESLEAAQMTTFTRPKRTESRSEIGARDWGTGRSSFGGSRPASNRRQREKAVEELRALLRNDPQLSEVNSPSGCQALADLCLALCDKIF